jgi:hypothetical protein
MWQSSVELFDDVANTFTYFLYKDCRSSFAAAMLGKNAITDDCIFVAATALQRKISGHTDTNITIRDKSITLKNKNKN